MTVHFVPPRERWRELAVVPKSPLPWDTPAVDRPTFVAPGYLALPPGGLTQPPVEHVHQPVFITPGLGTTRDPETGERIYGAGEIGIRVIGGGLIAYVFWLFYGDRMKVDMLPWVAAMAFGNALYPTYKNYRVTGELFPLPA